MTVKQIPGATQGSMLPDVYALSGASQSDEALLGRILDDLKAGDRPIDAIQILYQTAAGAPGLVSATVDADAVFALRTNTTTVSQPPQGLLGFAFDLPAGVSVGASTDVGSDGGYGFLQIIQQATVTNAPGYYLRFIDKSGNSLPTALFVKGVAQVTLLVTYKPGSGSNQNGSPLAIQPYHNAVVLAGTQNGLVYYAETADPALRRATSRLHPAPSVSSSHAPRASCNSRHLLAWQRASGSARRATMRVAISSRHCAHPASPTMTTCMRLCLQQVRHRQR